MVLLPGLYRSYQEGGIKPVVMVSDQFVRMLDGCSYIIPEPVRLHWFRDVHRAAELARQKYGWCLIPKWWDDPLHPVPPPAPGEETIVLEYRRQVMEVPASQWRSYMLGQWVGAGFATEELGKWPLVFDRRDKEREQQLILQIIGKNPKPVILYNLKGQTSPLPSDDDVLRELFRLRGHYKLVDISEIKAHRIYDLLGLYELAELLFTADTSTLHLANACQIKTVAFIANGGAGSMTVGNIIYHCRYEAVKKSLFMIASIVDGLIEQAPKKIEKPRKWDRVQTMPAYQL